MSDNGEFDYCRDLYTTSSSNNRLREFFDRAVAYGRRVIAPAGTSYGITHERLREALDTLRDYGYLNGYTLDARDEPVISLTQPNRGDRQHDLRTLAINEARAAGDMVVQGRDREAYIHSVQRFTDDTEVQTENVAAFFFNRGAYHGRASNREDRRKSRNTWRPMRDAPRDGSTILIRKRVDRGFPSYDYMDASHMTGTGESPGNDPAIWCSHGHVVVTSSERLQIDRMEFIPMPNDVPTTEPVEAAAEPAQGTPWEPRPMDPRPSRRMRI